MNGAQKQREIFRRAEVVRQEIKKLRDKDPQLTHVQAWRKLLQTKPHLFADVSDAEAGEGPGDARIQEGKRMIRVQAASDLREAVKGLQQAQPGLSFVEAWELARKERPALFESAKRIESDNWGPVARPSLVHAAKKPAARSKPKDDSQVYVVYGSSGEVIDLQLS